MKKDRIKLDTPEAFMEALNRYQTVRTSYSTPGEDSNPLSRPSVK
ncbi:MAG: hypothetical protein ACFFE8_02980 [Candidatus Heimdallarchaeota archaeon]